MQALKEFISGLVKTPTVTGFERQNAGKILEKCIEYTGDFFTDSRVTNSASVVLQRKSKSKNPKKLCFDAHIDTVGFIVSEIFDSGFVRVAPLGGIDSNILPSSEVIILGKKEIPAVFTSIPPHLSRSDSLPEVSELFCDTGIVGGELKKYIDIGTAVAFKPEISFLANNRLACPGLDDKICIAAIMEAVKNIDTACLDNTEITVYLSSGEERGGKGSYMLYDETECDACIVLDVNFAEEKQSKKGEYGVLGQGAMLSFSSVTSRELTLVVEEAAKASGQKLQTVCEMTSTGTNADVCARTGKGIAASVLSVPLKYMHSFTECASLYDVKSAAKILAQTALLYDKTDVAASVYYVKGGNDCVL